MLRLRRPDLQSLNVAIKIGISNVHAFLARVPSSELEPRKIASCAENMLTELLLKTGFPLTSPVERLSVGGGTVWNVDSGKMVLLLERIDDAIRDYLLDTKPAHVVCLDTVFEDNDQLLTNLKLQLSEAGVELTVV